MISLKAAPNFLLSYMLMSDYTTLNSTLDNFGTNPVDIEKSIIIELQNILKWLDVNKFIEIYVVSYASKSNTMFIL